MEQIQSNLEEIKQLVDQSMASPSHNDQGAIDLIIELSDSKNIDIPKKDEEDDDSIEHYDFAMDMPIQPRDASSEQFVEEIKEEEERKENEESKEERN